MIHEETLFFTTIGSLVGEGLPREQDYAYLKTTVSRKRLLQDADNSPRPYKFARFAEKESTLISEAFLPPVCYVIPPEEGALLYPKSRVSQGCQTTPLPVSRLLSIPTDTRTFPMPWAATKEPSPLSLSNPPKRRKSSIEDLCDDNLEEDDLDFLLGELGAFDTECEEVFNDHVLTSSVPDDVDQHEGVEVMVLVGGRRCVSTNTINIPNVTRPTRQAKIRTWRSMTKQFKYSNN